MHSRNPLGLLVPHCVVPYRVVPCCPRYCGSWGPVLLRACGGLHQHHAHGWVAYIRPPTMVSPIPALPLILTHKLLVGSASFPRQSSIHSGWCRGYAPPLPRLSLLKPSIGWLPCSGSHPTLSLGCQWYHSDAGVHVSSSSCLFPILCV